MLNQHRMRAARIGPPRLPSFLQPGGTSPTTPPPPPPPQAVFPNFINGKFVPSAATEKYPVHNPVCALARSALGQPNASAAHHQLLALDTCVLCHCYHPTHLQATQEIVAYAPQTTDAEFEEAVSAAKTAFESWSNMSTQNRVRVMLKYQALIREHMDEIAAIITREQGKTLADAKGDVFRGLEVVEHACTAPSVLMGETQGNIASHMDMMTLRAPLGVCAGIAPCM